MYYTLYSIYKLLVVHTAKVYNNCIQLRLNTSNYYKLLKNRISDINFSDKSQVLPNAKLTQDAMLFAFH